MWRAASSSSRTSGGAPFHSSGVPHWIGQCTGQDKEVRRASCTNCPVLVFMRLGMKPFRCSVRRTSSSSSSGRKISSTNHTSRCPSPAGPPGGSSEIRRKAAEGLSSPMGTCLVTGGNGTGLPSTLTKATSSEERPVLLRKLFKPFGAMPLFKGACFPVLIFPRKWSGNCGLFPFVHHLYFFLAAGIFLSLSTWSVHLLMPYFSRIASAASALELS
mmetsp:Transcript_67992/g.145572  ORF Transcript_67992/g.145572 Transcript_67992/m.145572 type:complete len:216 (-) Transcript_67992:609-1256(-)